MPEISFSGPVPEWLSPEHLGLPFASAKWDFGKDELFRVDEIANRGASQDGFRTLSPLTYVGVEHLTSRWGREPLLLFLVASLQRGDAIAFGDPERAGTPPEWIATRLWQDLAPDAANDRLFSGGGSTFWNVRVVDPAAVQGKARALASPSGEESPEKVGGRQGGRPRLSAFTAFVREVVKIADGLNGLPDLPSRPGEPDPLFQRMRDWADRQPTEIKDSTLRDYVRDVDYRRPRD